MDELQNALDTYLSDRVNFGPDDRATRLAEEDAFRAGWTARKWADVGVTA